MFFSKLDHQIPVHLLQDDAERVIEGGLHVSRAARLVVGEDETTSLVHNVGTDHPHIASSRVNISPISAHQTRLLAACAPPSCTMAADRVLQSNFSDIVTAISTSEPLKVADRLFEVSLISQETLDKVILPTNTSDEKSRILVLSVLNQVKLVPEKLEEFKKILQRSIDQRTYDSKLQSSPGLPSLATRDYANPSKLKI